MDWSDQPAAPAHDPQSPFATPPVSPAPAAARPTLNPARRTIATIGLAVGLLTLGGAAAVFAADPSASPAPAATTQPSTGGTGNGAAGTTDPAPRGAGRGAAHDGVPCPNDGTAPSGSAAPTTPSAPSTDPTPVPSAEL